MEKNIVMSEEVYDTILLLEEKNRQRILYRLMNYVFGKEDLFIEDNNNIEDILILLLSEQIIIKG